MIYNPISAYPHPLNVTALPRYCVFDQWGAAWGNMIICYILL